MRKQNWEFAPRMNDSQDKWIVKKRVFDKIIKQEEESFLWVDLGLPSGTLWAAWNVGATKPEEFGVYFAWGETQGYEGITIDKQFTWDDYKFSIDGSSSNFTRYNSTDSKTTLEQVDDAAYQSDNTCRIPTKADLEELKANTISAWETLNGVNGIRFTSNTNGNSIFVPAAGGCGNGSVYDVGTRCDLWSSSLYSSLYRSAHYLTFSSSNVGVSELFRYYGLTVRPVKSNN